MENVNDVFTGVLGVGFQEYGSEEELTLDPIQHLYQVYVRTSKAAENNPSIWERAKELFRRMEQGEIRSVESKKGLNFWLA